MHRFFMGENGLCGDTAELDAQDAQHALRVLRLEGGASIELMGNGRRYQARIEQIGVQGVRARILRELPSTEPRARVTLFQGVPKAEKLELIVQKATELGAYAVQPVDMARCVTQIKDKDKKRERWQKIAREAAKQCGRAYVPNVYAPVKISAISGMLGELDALLVPWEDARDGSLQSVLAGMDTGGNAPRIGIVIGPEGGISSEEAQALYALGGKLLTLGPRILRTETAAIAALTLTLGFLGEMQ